MGARVWNAEGGKREEEKREKEGMASAAVNANQLNSAGRFLSSFFFYRHSYAWAYACTCTHIRMFRTPIATQQLRQRDVEPTCSDPVIVGTQYNVQRGMATRGTPESDGESSPAARGHLGLGATENNAADLLTKPLPSTTFATHRARVMGGCQNP